jgi:hypothetical protein
MHSNNLVRVRSGGKGKNAAIGSSAVKPWRRVRGKCGSVSAEQPPTGEQVEHRTGRWRPSPEVVTGVGRTHALHCVSGTVIRPGGVDERAAFAVVHDALLLQESGGQEHVFQLEELQVAARFGDAVSVLSAGGEPRPVIVVKNHSSDDTYYDEEALLRLFLHEPRGVLWTALLICTCFTPLIFGVPWSLLKRARARRAVAKFKDELEFVSAA